MTVLFQRGIYLPQIDLWLDPEIRDPLMLQQILVPAPDDTVYAHPISRLVNDVKNDGPELTKERPAELLV